MAAPYAMLKHIIITNIFLSLRSPRSSAECEANKNINILDEKIENNGLRTQLFILFEMKNEITIIISLS